MDGHFTRVYSYHFSLLNHFRYKVRVSFPYYLLYSLRKSLDDHKKNPKGFPILHTGLIRLIFEHYQKMPAPANLDAPSNSEEEDTEPSCIGYLPNLNPVRIVLSPSSIQICNKSLNPHSVKACSMPKPGSPTLKTRSVGKMLKVKNLVSYYEDSPEYEDSGANNTSFYAALPLDRDARNGSPIIPNPAKTCFNPEREPSVDVLGLARNNDDDHFRVSKWFFHEINELKIKT